MRTVAHKNYLATLASVMIAVSAICHAPAAHAQAVVPPQSESFPLTYGEWGARWWQYLFSIPIDYPNPIFDSTGKQCHVGQWGPVFFLVGTFGGNVVRSCKVPEGVGLFFPIINIACAIPDDGDTVKKIVKVCSTDALDQVDVSSLFVIIDGKRVQNLDKFRASEFFSFAGAVPGVSAKGGCVFTDPNCYEGFRNTAFQDGYWVMLTPLSRGKHTVRFGGAIKGGGFKLDVTYNLTVVPQEEDNPAQR